MATSGFARYVAHEDGLVNGVGVRSVGSSGWCWQCAAAVKTRRGGGAGEMPTVS